MALPDWMLIVLRIIHDLSHFLLFGTLADVDPEPVPAPSLPPTPFQDVSPTTTPSFRERTLNFLVTSLGITLPHSVTIIQGLPTATAVLLRLTEIIPADVVLFLCLTGIVVWIAVVSGGALFILWGSIRLVRSFGQPLSASATLSVPTFTEEPDAPITAPPALPTTPTFPHLPHAHASPALPPTPAARTPLPLSDAAQSLTGLVLANNQCPTNVTSRRRRRWDIETSM